MPMKLCTFVSPDRIPCPALATADSAFCPAHRDKDLFVRVVNRKTNKPVLCLICGEEIAKGTLQKMTASGPVHAEFACVEKARRP
jgi:hypothetical protein